MKRYGHFLFLLAIYFLPLDVFGSHAMGTDITYECIGLNQYRVRVAFYRDCSGIGAPTSVILDYFSPSCNISSGTFSLALSQQSSQEVSPLCPSQLINSTCNGGFYPGVEQYVYQGVITLPQQCSDWVIGYAECCRNNSITNLASAASYNLYAFATINNTGGLCDNSPVFTTLPVPYICAGVPFNYNQGAVDIDGDSLAYELIVPLDNYNSPIAYTGSFNVDYPMSTTTGVFVFDSTTGQMTFTPNIQQVAVVTVQVKAYRNGVLVGSTMRDIQVVVIADFLCTNQSPAISPITSINGGGFIGADSSTVQMCPNTPLTFDIDVTDANGDVITLTSNATTAIPGSNFTVIGSGSSVTGGFSWTPTVADTGFHPFQVTYRDNGCPVSTPQTVTYIIYVFNKVVASVDQVFCGTPIQLSAIGGSYFTWNPPAGLTAANIPNPVATPTIPTYYTVTSDCGVDSVFVDVQPPFTLNAGSDVSICLNALTQLEAVATPGTFAPYTFEWSPATGLSFTDIANPIANPTVTTTYAVVATSAQGCIKHDTVKVTISGVAPSVIAFTSKDTVCPGETVQLDLTTAPVNCGLSVTPCNTTPLDYTLGSSSQSTGIGTPYEGFWEDGRVQYLYRASELNAMGVSGGTIKQIAFNISDKQSTIPYSGFTIRMGCTNLTALSSFVPGLTPVYGPTAYTTSTGWNSHVLTSGYDWDGVSSLIVEVCFDNNNFTGDDDVNYTTTPFVSVAYDYTDGSSGCSLIGPTTSSDRPNTRFSICQQSITNASINWSPSVGMQNPNSPNPLVRVFGSTTFIVDVDEGGCVGQGFVDVVVDTTVIVIAGTDTALCIPTPVQLTAVSYGVPSPIQLTCGINGTPVAASNNYSLGTGTSVTSTPTPFKGSFHDNRVQMLIRESELSALGLERGVFTALSFNVAFKNSTQAFRGFTIKMGCTNSDVIGNTFDPNMFIVFTPKDITTTTGWNTFALDNTYDWDGFSNVLVEVCFNNVGYAGEDIVNFTATSFPSALYASADYLAGCNLTTAIATNSRTDMRFGISAPPPGIYTYAWSPGTGLDDRFAQNPISNTTATTEYVVTVTDGICVASDTVTIRFYTSYDVNVFGQNIGCNGNSDGNAVSVPNGGVLPYSFIWNTGQTANGVLTDTLYNLLAGTYQITVSDNNGCEASDSIIITVPPPLSVNATANNVSCFGGNNGSALASGTGGTLPYDFLWSNGDTIASAGSLIVGNYQVTLTDGSGCLAFDAVTIVQPAAIVSSISVTDVSCYRYSDGSATVNVSGGNPPFSYVWSDSQTTSTATALPAGTFIVTITDDSNCAHLDTTIVNQPDSFGIVVAVTDINCFNGSDGVASASVLGDTVNYQFLWNSNPSQITAIATGLPAGNVLLVVTDTNTCSINSLVTIGSPQQIQLAASAQDALCFSVANGYAEVHVVSGGTSPFDYLWSNALTDSNTTGISADDYFVTVTDVNGCEEFDTVIVGEPAAIAIQDSVVDVSCFGFDDGRILVTVSGGTPSFSFLWSNADITPIANDLIAGNYSVTVTDLNGCVDSLTGIIVTEPSAILLGAIDVTPPCSSEATGAILFSASGGTEPYLFILDSTVTQSNPEFTGLTEGNHSIAVMDDNGCSIDTSVTVIAYDSVHVAFDSSEIKINLGQQVALNPVIQPANLFYNYSWEPSTGLSCNNCPNPVASPLITTPYQLTVFDENGCRYSETIIIEVDNELILVVPNAFTPNGDGVNDYLNVYGISLLSIEFSVFNRWGEKLWETNNLSEGWDGSYRNKLLPPDVYVYYVDAEFTDGQKKQIKGSTTILK